MWHCPAVLEYSRKMKDGPAAEDAAVFLQRLGIEGMQILPAGELAGQRRQADTRAWALAGPGTAVLVPRAFAHKLHRILSRNWEASASS